MRLVGEPISSPIDTVFAATNWLSSSNLALPMRAWCTTASTIGVIVRMTMSLDVKYVSNDESRNR
jgi:hypothetical protein